MLALFWLNPRAIILDLEPGAAGFATAADLNPAVAITRGVNHHIGQRALDRERMNAQRDLAGLQVRRDFTFVTAFRRDNFTEHRVKIRQLHRHLLARAQVINKLLDDGVTLFDIFIDRLGKVTVLFPHHLRRQTNTRQRRTQIVADAGH